MNDEKQSMKRFYGRGIPGVQLEQLQGKLIVIEGADGSGRSTQIELLRDWLERLGFATEDVGLKRSMLVSEELEEAKQGNILSPRTLSLYYATDFADQMENTIIPALRAGFIVLADRYIYTLMARDIVRGLDPDWVRDVYSIALIPDAVFYLSVFPKRLAEWIIRKAGELNYWESGMDIKRSGNLYTGFLNYQRRMMQEFKRMQSLYQFDTINGNRSIRTISQELQTKIESLLQS
jgi:dTMP kinase